MREVKLLYSSPPAVKGGRYGHLKPARHAIFVVLLLVFNSPASDLLSAVGGERFSLSGPVGRLL